MPHAAGKLAAMEANQNADFMYYTTATTLFQIIDNRCIWMRNARCMNDLSEMIYGRDQILSALSKDNRRKRFVDACDSCVPGAASQPLDYIENRADDLIDQTYITCLSEHDRIENPVGRLSMWRAYAAGDSGIGLVITKSAMFSETNALGVISSPVAYYSTPQLEAEFDKIIENIRANQLLLQGLGKQGLERWLMRTLILALTCLKHPAFAEEKEWRVLYLRNYLESTALREKLVTLGGVPQRIYEIPLEAHTGYDIRFDNLMKEVIVGPTSYPKTAAEAVVRKLELSEVSNASGRVKLSNIPLRL